MVAMVQKGKKVVPATIQDLNDEVNKSRTRTHDARQQFENLKSKFTALFDDNKKYKKRTSKSSAQKRGKQPSDFEKIFKIWDKIDKITVAAFAEVDAMHNLYGMAGTLHQSEIQNLRSRDNRNDGPNTPPSKNSVTGQKKKAIRNNSKQPSGRKPGGQPGHEGANKGKTKKIDQIKTYRLKKCTCCGSKNIHDVGHMTETRTEIPPRPKSVTTKHIIFMYMCHDCVKDECKCNNSTDKGVIKGQDVEVETVEAQDVEVETVEAQDVEVETVEAQDVEVETVEAQDVEVETVEAQDTKDERIGDTCAPNIMTAKAGIPKEGLYGVNALVEVLDNYIKRQPNRMNSDSMSRDDVGMSNGTVSHVLDRFGMYTALPTEEIKLRIRKCKLLNIDETSVRYKGTTYWLWVFYDPLTGTTYYIIRKSRGSDVLLEVLGPDWDGLIVCDGWTAYNKHKIQRCWAHIIRELETLSLKNPDSDEAAAALATLRKIFHDAKETCKKPKYIRVKSIKNLKARVRRLIRKYSDDPVIGEFMPKLGRALPNLFHFVLDPRIPPTNNFAEQYLREPVIVRGIRGSIRSEKSLERTAALFTCVTTWKNHGLDPLEEMKKHIPMI